MSSSSNTCDNTSVPQSNMSTRTMTHTGSNIAGKEENVHIDDNCCMARVFGDSNHPGRQCRHKKSPDSPDGDYCHLHAKQAEVTTEPLQMQDITISQADRQNLTKSKLQYGLFMGRIDQPRPQLNENGEACLIWPDQYRQGDKIYWRKDNTLVTDKWHPLEARYHNLHKTHPQVIHNNSTEPTEDSDPFDWEYMTNGTGGCAKCGRRDVPLTASIEDGRLYASECWDEYAWQWSYLNPDSMWRDNEHKSFTLTVEDIYRANNPRPFGYVEHDAEDIESLTDRSVDHMQNIPHRSHDEDRTPTPTLPQFQYDDEYSSDENLTLQIDELKDNRQENILKIDFMNQIIIGLKKDIHSISRLIIKLEKSEHPVIVEYLSKEAEKLYLQYGSAWKPFFLEANCENKHNKTLHQKKFNELVNFYDCMAEEYSITSVTECNNLLYLRHYNIQETIEQPTTFQEEVWSKYDEFTVELMEEEIEQLKQKLHSKLNSQTYITHIISCFFNIPTPELEFAKYPSFIFIDMVSKLQSKGVPCIFNRNVFWGIQNWHDHIDLVIETLIETWFGSLHTAPMPPSRYAKLVQIDEQIRWLQTQRPEDGGLHYNYDNLLIPCL